MPNQSSTVAPPRVESTGERERPAAASTRIAEFRITILQSQIAALERDLEAERDRQQAVVDRYERILEEQ